MSCGYIRIILIDREVYMLPGIISMNTTITIQTVNLQLWNLIRVWSSCNTHTVGGIV